MTHIQKISNILMKELGAKDAKIMQSWITKLLEVNNKPSANTYELRIIFKTKKPIETQTNVENIPRKIEVKRDNQSNKRKLIVNDVKKSIKNQLKIK